MSNSFDFLWIDDDKSRKTTAANLEKNTGAKVYFYNVKNKDLAIKIGESLDKHSPDLIIVDHKLDKVSGPLRDKLKSTGATAAEVIKDSKPQIPVVCVTKVDIKSDLTFSQKAAYDAIFNATHLTSQSQLFVSIADGFKKISHKPPKSEKELIKLFDCPEEDNTRLRQVLPQDVKVGFETPGYASVLWRWIRDVFFERPGFLYDTMWTATLVGAKESSFIKAQKKLEHTRYKGIFANDAKPRWWYSRILETLYKNSPDDGQDDPRLLGRKFLEIPKQGYSKCEISRLDLPDTVAFSDVTNKVRRQVRIQFTEEHPGFQKLLFFDEMRIIKEEQ